jgi:hypothetical protein
MNVYPVGQGLRAQAQLRRAGHLLEGRGDVEVEGRVTVLVPYGTYIPGRNLLLLSQ